MIKPVKAVTVTGTSSEAEQNQQINDFIRGNSNSILPRNVQNNPVLRAMFQSDDDDQNGGDDRGN